MRDTANFEPWYSDTADAFVICGDIKVSDAPGWCKLALCGKKTFKTPEFAQLTEETKKLAKVSNQMDLLQIQAFENDLNEAIPFSL